jgi:hypothetical protein
MNHLHTLLVRTREIFSYRDQGYYEGICLAAEIARVELGYGQNNLQGYRAYEGLDFHIAQALGAQEYYPQWLRRQLDRPVTDEEAYRGRLAWLDAMTIAAEKGEPLPPPALPK